MTLTSKSWLWKLTWPFAHANYTTLWNTVYYPKDHTPTGQILAHEKIHSEQQHRWGWFFLPIWIFCYLFCLPILVNPFREVWEMEAYVQGSGLSPEEARKILKTYRYGWLL